MGFAFAKPYNWFTILTQRALANQNRDAAFSANQMRSDVAVRDFPALAAGYVILLPVLLAFLSYLWALHSAMGLL